MSDRNVIHKQVIRLNENLNPTALVYEFGVPIDALMVDIQWDSTDPHGIAFWYQTAFRGLDDPGHELKFWKMIVKDTGEAYPAGCSHQATVVRNGIVLHVLDAEGFIIEWAPCCAHD